MATEDRSRSAFYPGKHYAGVRMQQGRVLTDDDYNEGEHIQHEDQRLTRIDVIGARGAPDGGFAIDHARADDDGINFGIGRGTFYLGGLRLMLERYETFRTQKDWLQNPLDVDSRPVTTDRFDFVYLEAWQQPVSAVEDDELFEVALDGPDTATRLRTMRRVHVAANVETDDCAEGWARVVERLRNEGYGTWNESTHELEAGDIQLTVSFTDGDSENHCRPSVEGGYLGAENQAIRVQLTDAGHFTWGFDNGAPLYRIQANTVPTEDGGLTTVTMIDLPKDPAHWPRSGQIVEILPWSAQLANGEKLAEELMPGNHFSQVASGYRPQQGHTFTLSTQLPDAFGANWKLRTDHAALAAKGEYLFLRVWDRGSDLTSEAEIELGPDPVPLGHTSLAIRIGGDDRRPPGDYWIIAARPHSPGRVVPWELETGRLPDGIRRFYAPLALIHWPSGEREGVIYDYRKRFRPLTELKTCCSCTVGTGGDYATLREALDQLCSAGGEICLLPGLHQASVHITGRRNIRIKGCSGQTRIIPSAYSREEPIFRITDSQSITLEHLDLVTIRGTATVLKCNASGELKDIDIGHNRILAAEHGIDVRAIELQQGQNVHIHNNRIRMLDSEAGRAALFVSAEDGLIERNDISVIPSGTVPPSERELVPIDPSSDLINPESFYENASYVALYSNYVWRATKREWPEANPEFHADGGIQIADGCERIRVISNRICGGASNGITLGTEIDAEILESLPRENVLEYDSRPYESYFEVQVRVTDENAGVSGVVLVLVNIETGQPITYTTNESGFCIPPVGHYGVLIAYPNYVINEIEFQAPDPELWTGRPVPVFRVKVRAVMPEIDVLAASYELLTASNEISGMGLSGIGTPQRNMEQLPALWQVENLPILAGNPPLVLHSLLALRFGVVSGLVTDLTIKGNHVFNCLQRDYNQASMQALAAIRGEGGISLGMCENLVIRDNRIEDNGRDYLEPACGVFVSYASQVDIDRNQITSTSEALPQTDEP